ncbi:MAG: 30S ribosomal protein S4 [Bdellovibrionales bacterium]|nr:30S ribosomal protein S4 [Bdellovibrionales bacterium]
MKKKSFARFKVQRRFGMEFPGLGKKGALERRPYPPGESGSKRRKYSDFALRLEEKQKIRFHYVLREHQLRRFIRASKKGSTSNWVEKLAGLLERRLDNIIFRLGLAPSMLSARQLVSHGHVLVNDKKVNIPSYVVQKGDNISITQKAMLNQNVIQAVTSPRLDLPDFLTKEDKQGRPVGVVQDIPGVGHIPFTFDAGLFTEYYAARKA